MKKLIICAVAIAIVSCTRVADTKTLPHDELNARIGVLVDSLFDAMPNAMNNDITRANFADSIRSSIQSFRGTSLPYITDIPFIYVGCVQYPEGVFLKDEGKFLVRFTYTDGITPTSDNFHTSLHVVSVMEKDDVARLVDNATYFVDGTFVDFANNSRETGFQLPNGKCLVSYPALNANAFLDLGTIVLNNLSFTRIENGHN